MGDEAAGLRYWRKYSSMVLGVVALSSTIIFLLSEPILRYFNVSEISIIEILQIFRLSLLLPILLAVTLPLEQLMFLLNKSRIYVPITIIVTSVNVILIIILTHWLQLAGVIVALIIAEFLFILIYYRYALYRTAIK
jgi:O-antigen/teichoic acid export membrane protein